MRRNRRLNIDKLSQFWSLPRLEAVYYITTHEMKQRERKINELIKKNRKDKELMCILEKELFGNKSVDVNQ